MNLVMVTVLVSLAQEIGQINDVGLDPDYPVEMTEEDIENELDPQLDKAVEVLLDTITN